jgi:hypothetical protein
MRKNSNLTLEYLVMHILRTGAAHNVRSDRKSRMLYIYWSNGESIGYVPAIWQDLPSFRRFIQAQKEWIKIAAN